MKRLLLVLLMGLGVVPVFAQNVVVVKPDYTNTRTFAASGSGPCWGPLPAGVGYHTIRWYEIGTISAGTVKLQGSNDACVTVTDIITAQATTSSGAVVGTAGAYKYVQLVSASQAGTGQFDVWYGGYNGAVTTSSSGGLTDTELRATAVAVSEADGANVTLGAKADAKSTATDTTAVTIMQVLKEVSFKIQALADGTATASVTDLCDGASHTPKRYISVGASEDESEVKATAGALCSIIASNSHATTAAYVKCTNLTAANTTPGSSAIYFDFIVPPASTAGISNLDLPFDTALTCYIVTGKAENDVAEVAATDVRYTLTYQ